MKNQHHGHHQRRYVSYCVHCGWGFTPHQARTVNFCPQCGTGRMAQPAVHVDPPAPRIRYQPRPRRDRVAVNAQVMPRAEGWKAAANACIQQAARVPEDLRRAPMETGAKLAVGGAALAGGGVVTTGLGAKVVVFGSTIAILGGITTAAGIAMRDRNITNLGVRGLGFGLLTSAAGSAMIVTGNVAAVAGAVTAGTGVVAMGREGIRRRRIKGAV